MFEKVNHDRLERALSQLYTSVYGADVKVTLKQKKSCQQKGNSKSVDCCNNQRKQKNELY